MTPVLANIPVRPGELSLAGFLGVFFAALDAREIRYCVLHSFDRLPEVVTSDVDIAILPGDLARLPDVLAAVQAHGYRVIQCLNYEVHGYYFIFAWTEASSIRTLAIDIICEHREGRLILTSGEELLRDRRRFRDFWIPSAAAEYRYLLSKKVLKGSVRPLQSRRLAELANLVGPDHARAICTRLFGNRHGEEAATASIAGTFEQNLGQWESRLRRRILTRQPWMPLLYHAESLPRLARRLTNPTGLFIAILGPDGVGKSTLIENINTQLAHAFRRSKIFHWRPTVLFPDRSKPVSQPHARPSYGPVKSLLHLAAHFADNVLGFPLRIQPLLARSGLVIFDRYFYDLAADPKRYRYGGPQGLPKALFGAVPRPDLVLVLDAPEGVVLSRKAETTIEEIRLGRERYRSLSQANLPIRPIDASQTADQVAFDACQLVLGALETRFVARHPEWLTPSAVEEVVEILGSRAGISAKQRFAVLPGFANPRWMVPLPNHGEGLGIYTPYARAARLKKALMSATMQLPSFVWARDIVSIPSPGPLEDLVRQVFGKFPSSFSISLGTPGLHRNATVQIQVDGRIRGFLKLPLTPQASLRVEHEAGVLAQLSTVSSIRAFLPQVLFAGQWEGRFVLLQSPLDGRPGCVRFGKDHRVFLRELSSLESRRRPVPMLLEQIVDQWESVAHRMGFEDRRVVEDTVCGIEQLYSGLSLACGYSHGDFAPWNIRQLPDRLGVFDWESAHPQRPHEWDAFHFQTQTASLLGRDAGYRVDTSIPESDCSYLLYLVHSLSLLLKEQNAGRTDVTYRIEQLRAARGTRKGARSR